MKALNSLILEGSVGSEVVEVKEKVGEIKLVYEEKEQFTIVFYGQMCEMFKKYAEIGRGIRVVGRIIQDNNEVKVFCEHVEFKPKVRKNK